MSIASEITRISGNIADAYTALDGKGATLPAAGSQNSANLADTIDTITVGGGGAAGIPSEVKTLIDNATTKTLNEIKDTWTLANTWKKSGANLANTGTDGITVYVFDDSVPSFYVGSLSYTSYNLRCIKASSGTIITDVSDVNATTNGCFHIDFSNATDKWVAFPDVISSPDKLTGLFQLSTTMVWGYDVPSNIWRHVKYLCIGSSLSSYSTSNKQSLNIGVSSDGACGFPFIGSVSPVLAGVYAPRTSFQYSYLDDASYIPFGALAPISKLFDIEQFITDYVPSGLTYGVTAMSANTTKSILNYYLQKINDAEKFPLVLDCSGISASSNTWYIGSKTYTNDEKKASVPSELFIIPPDMNITWGGTGNTSAIAQSTCCQYVTTRAIRFMATNSPNVTNRTLTIGAGNIARINAEDATIIPALQAKGWTVT